MRVPQRAKKILRVLTAEWQSGAEVAAAANVPINYTYSALDRLDELGYIEQTFDTSMTFPRHLIRLTKDGMRNHAR